MDESEPIGREDIRREYRRIIATREFARAPVMRRLLGFLVDESLAGRGAQLKAYSVAVQGLGREADFDPQSDSYPRVQVGRLRRMLDAAYAREGAPNGFSMTIPLGSYAMRFVAAERMSAPPEPTPPAPEPAPIADQSRLAARVIAILIVIAAALLILLPLIGRREVATGQPSVAPVLELGQIVASPALASVRRETVAVLEDALRRTFLVRLREDAARPEQASTVVHYELLGGLANGGASTLRLRLARMPEGDVIWTGSATLPGDRARIPETLAPLITELIQPYGVLATDQRNRLQLPAAPGHDCRLLLDRYRRDRVVALYDATRACIIRTLKILPNDPRALAGAAVLMLDSMIYFDPQARDRPQKSFALASRAIAADPYGPLGHFAMARAALFMDACPTAVREGGRAIALNPYDPEMLAIIGLIFLNCGDPRDATLLRRAVTLDPDAPGWTWASLLLIAIDRDDRETALAAARSISPGSGATPALNDMAIAVAFAANGQARAARAAWARVEIASPSIAADPDLLLLHRMLPAKLRAKMLAHLRSAGIRTAPVRPG